jgi:aspartyl-tRNA(Asn)/glutamyl-tRNA(Gln) amidotransferase subunit B
VIAAHPDELEKYRAGKKKLQGFFVGQSDEAHKRPG